MPKGSQSEDTLILGEGSSNSHGPQLPSDHQFSMVILEGKNVGMEFPIQNWTVIIGRDASVSDLVIDDPGASRSHACLEYQDGTFVIEDLESTNGLCVNEKPVQKSVLKNSDKVTIGKTVLQFVVDQGRPAPKVYEVESL